MDLSRLQGIFTPVVTPFTPDEQVDHPSLRRLIDFVIDAGGVHGIWIMGTTGEFASLTEDERARSVETTVQHVRGRVPVVANIGDCSSRLAIRHAEHAVRAGADALAMTPPYYYPGTMDEMLSHFRVVKQAFPDTPLLIYNIPPTVKVKMALSTTLELAREGTVDGIKDSQNDLVWFRNLALAIHSEGLSDRFRLFLGTRTLIDAGVQIGAHGVIPATSNVAPRACVTVFDAACRGDFETAGRAAQIIQRFEDLAKVARAGSENAASIGMMKELLQAWGVIDHATMTRPLRQLAPDERSALLTAVESIPRLEARAAAPA